MHKHLYLIIFLLSISLLANAKATLGFPGEDHASVGIYIKDLKTGDVVAQNDSKRALVPASVMKAVTAAAAITSLGEDFKFSTPVYLSGRRSIDNDSVWIGNLVIQSSGDPTIDSENFDDRKLFANEIVDALKKKGIREITGTVVIEETLKDAGCVPQWEIDDVAWAYGAGLYGFNFHDNYVQFWPASGKTSPFVPDLDVTRIKGNNGCDLLRGIYSNHIVAIGNNVNNPNLRMNTTMNSPAQVFAYALKEKLRKESMEIGEKSVNNNSARLDLLNHKSPTLHEILKQMLVHSHNLYAEGMLRAIVSNGTRKEALAKEKTILQNLGVNTAYNYICDGSGLSRANRVNPEFVSNVLEAMLSSKYSNEYVSYFPKAGKEGTVKKLLANTPLSGQLVLKSGSMNAVQCYAGYKIDNDGNPTHTIVILVNCFYCDRSALRASIEKFLLNAFK